MYVHTMIAKNHIFHIHVPYVNGQGEKDQVEQGGPNRWRYEDNG